MLGVAGNTVARWERGKSPIGNPDLVVLAIERLEAAREVEADQRDLGGSRSQSLRRTVHNLPNEQTSLIGREQDLVAIGVTLLESVGRLVTLTGPGGSGKSRLALRTGRDLIAHFSDGVWMVELASLSDAARVPEAVATCLNVKERPGQTPSQTLVAALAKRQMLIVLDNCERLTGACAQLTELLLSNCTRIRILATSREPLSVGGEMVWRVAPLVAPGPQDSVPEISMSAAVRLFVDRARSVRSSFTLTPDNVRAIGEICRRVDGLPLAVELAAAQVRVLGIEQIRERLTKDLALLKDDTGRAPARQRTLEATLDWSYATLDELDRLVFSDLSVFAGGWSLEAAEAVCADDKLEPSHVLGFLTRLVDRSLVIMEEERAIARYRFLQPIRQYAHEKLLAEGERDDATRRRHAAYFCELAEYLESVSRGRQARGASEGRLRELSNFRAAMAWAIESGEAEAGLRIACALEDLWEFGSFTEGRDWLQRLLNGASDPTLTRAKALRVIGGIAFYQGEYSFASEMLAESERMSRAIGDADGLADTLDRRGLVMWARGEIPLAEAMLANALELTRGLGARPLESRVLFHLGLVASDRGDFAQAQERHTRSLELAEEFQDDLYMARAYHGLGRVARQQGDQSHAQALYEAALERRRRAGETWGIALELVELAHMSLDEGDVEHAEASLIEALPLSRELRDPSIVARSLDGVAAVVAKAKPGHAVRIFGAAAALRETAGAPLSTDETALLARRLAAPRRVLGHERTLAETTAGRCMSIDDAIDYALSSLAGEANSSPAEYAHDRAEAGLTRREGEILRLVAAGRSNKDIAVKLVLSIRTVERHITNLYAKIDARSKAEATAYAFRHGLN